MQTSTQQQVTNATDKVQAKPTVGLKVSFPVTDYKAVRIPGLPGHPSVGSCFIKVTDIPSQLDAFMAINPRVPSRNKAGVLGGPVVKGILETLRNSPSEMAIKNQGIFLLVNNTILSHGKLNLTFTDIGKHGIINGGHTYAAIQEAIETASDEERTELDKAYVRLHIFQAIDEDYVPEIAEGLNRSKQVDDPSLANLQGEFDSIRKVLKGRPGEEAVAYHQGDSGSVYVSELLVYLSLFNPERFDDSKHPNGLYNRQALGLKYFTEDDASNPKMVAALIEKLPDFLWLSDSIKKATPGAAQHNGFEFGRAKIVPTERAGSTKYKGTPLPFLNSKMDYRVPNGWVYPILASFRANLKWDASKKTMTWKVPLAKMLPEVITELVGVCVKEHRDNNMRPELIGKRESAYAQCYTKVQLYLAKKGLL